MALIIFKHFYCTKNKNFSNSHPLVRVPYGKNIEIEKQTCSRKLHLRRRNQMPKPNPRRSNSHRRNQLRARILSAYDTCYICGKPVDKSLKTPHPLSPEVDEIIPVSRGGDPYSFTNCRLTHRQCNRLKSNHSAAYARAQIFNQPRLGINKNSQNVTSSW